MALPLHMLVDRGFQDRCIAPKIDQPATTLQGGSHRFFELHGHFLVRGSFVLRRPVDGVAGPWDSASARTSAISGRSKNRNVLDAASPIPAAGLAGHDCTFAWGGYDA